MMASRKELDHEPKSVRLDIKISLQDYPDIADLYALNPRRFSVAAVEALSLYSFILKKTGATSLPQAANAISIGIGDSFSVPAPLLAAEKTPGENGEAVSHQKRRDLSASAASALLQMDRDM